MSSIMFVNINGFPHPTWDPSEHPEDAALVAALKGMESWMPRHGHAFIESAWRPASSEVVRDELVEDCPSTRRLRDLLGVLSDPREAWFILPGAGPRPSIEFSADGVVYRAGDGHLKDWDADLDDVIEKVADHIVARRDTTDPRGTYTSVLITTPDSDEHLVFARGMWFEPTAPDFRDRLRATLLATSERIWDCRPIAPQAI